MTQLRTFGTPFAVTKSGRLFMNLIRSLNAGRFGSLARAVMSGMQPFYHVLVVANGIGSHLAQYGCWLFSASKVVRISDGDVP